MILLDTNALIWLDAGHRRARRLLESERLYASPASLLELQFLQQYGRIRLKLNASALVSAHEWMLDDPPSAEWFDQASGLSWTRDPFDRLLVAHARLRRWRLATGDAALLEHLSDRERLAL